MKQKFNDYKFRAETRRMIDVANSIIAEYQAQGYRLTLRQLYYQHVARGLIENTEKSYNNIGSIINKGRLAGLIDWDAIEDRTRNLRGTSHWNSPADIIRSAYHSFRIDKWDNQPNRVEVWVEKDALVGILERVCSRYDVNYFSCRGYVSQSEMYEAGRRISSYVNSGQNVTILHLGDHDPSGIDMTRDIRDRLELFMGGTEINRLALNWEQIELYNPPPNFAKETDARFSKYSAEYGTDSWELDALEPSVIEKLIGDNVIKFIDEDLWNDKVSEENLWRKSLREVYTRWDDVQEFVSKDV